MSSKSGDNWILYDGDCPFCAGYVRLARLRASVGPVRLINARSRGPEFKEAVERGFNLDEEMVFKFRGEMYAGDRCMVLISALSEQSGPITFVVTWIFSSPSRARYLYPILRFFRGLILTLLGRKKINE